MAGRRRRHAVQVLHRDLDRLLARERDGAREHLVEHDADRVEIGGGADRAAARLLGGEVLGRADDRSDLGHLAGAGARDAEVGDLAAAILADEHVVRLDVAMDDAVAVREPDGGQDLACVVHGDRHGQRALADDQLLEGRPLQVLHGDVRGALGLATVVDRHDVRVGEACGVLGLAAEALDEAGVGRVAVVEDLDRNAATQVLILGQVHRGHAAGAEAAQHEIAPVKEASDIAVVCVQEIKSSPWSVRVPA